MFLLGRPARWALLLLFFCLYTAVRGWPCVRARRTGAFLHAQSHNVWQPKRTLPASFLLVSFPLHLCACVYLLLRQLPESAALVACAGPPL